MLGWLGLRRRLPVFMGSLLHWLGAMLGVEANAGAGV